jgi:hypothetical protein
MLEVQLRTPRSTTSICTYATLNPPAKSSLLDRRGSGRSPDYRREGRGDDGEAGESHRRDVDLFFFSMSLGVYAVGKGKESDERWM